MDPMSGPHLIRGSVALPEAELAWRFSRSSGPGGQHVNTSDSRVELSFDLARTEALPEVWKRRALERLPAGIGFTGIAIALLGRNHPIGIALGALLWGF
ncbi:peptide chain release factor-like protein, partial [Streptomyces sp. NPDC007070]|uniref:peptide chain release factor-like protein n=1 Tax=Streptomyces sp. NPDC007070 TaxID=3154312 RepID=UPI0033E31709